jgi:D-glycero-alpha-D-manno-heptose-7-phosphate kinase
MVIVRAPVRISFGGGGTDLAAYYDRFGGFVVSAAITRYCYVIARDSADGSIRINSADYRIWESFEPGRTAVADPLALPKAAVEWFAERGLIQSGVDLFLASEVPPGSGLGSSSAMAVGLVRALASRAGMTLGPGELAELASWLEIERLGMPIGKQDQYASAFGGLNAIEFASDRVRVEPLDLPPNVMTELSSHLLLFSTGRTRDSAAILREQRENTLTNPMVVESLHRIRALAAEMRTSLVDGDLDQFGRLLDLGWQEKKGLATTVSSGAIDRWYDAARRAGALGGKVAGAGGGGFLLLYCPSGCQRAVRTAMARFGLRELSFDFDLTGAQEPADLPAEAGRLAMLVYGD